MKINLAYGKTGLAFELSDDLNVTIIEPRFIAGVDDPAEAIRQALVRPIAADPLASCVRPEHKIGIVVNDITRATPYHVILPALLNELRRVDDKNIIFFVATGTHRSSTLQELEGMLGAEIVNRFRIIQNDAHDEASHVTVGTTSRGNQVRILRDYVQCDIRILTGFIEPHFFAGFSGGGKAVMPGLAQLDTIMRNHSPAHIDDIEATWGGIDRNPIAQDIQEAARLAGPCFVLNVAINRQKEITGIFTGDLVEAHQRGCMFVKEQAMTAVDREFDIVVTGNSGFPLDLNLYQSVKGLSAAAKIVKSGGAIVMAADCWDGIPEHGDYGRLLAEAENPEALLAKIRRPGFCCRDMWQALIHAMVCQKARVYFYSDHLTDEQITKAMLHPVHSIPEAIDQCLIEYGSDAAIGVLPQGPLTIPYVRGR